MQLTRHILSNRLRVLVISLPHVHSVELGVFVKAGPRYETRSDAGLSHFAEHMFFRGTRGIPGTFRLHAEMERIGSPINALTSRDFCHYFFSLPPRNLPRAAELFSEIMLRPAFDGLDLERQIILEEYLADLDEDGQDLNLENHTRALLWPGAALGMNILGLESNIRGFTRDDLFRHHATFYTGANMVLYLAGAVTSEQALELAEKYFSRFPVGDLLAENAVKRTVSGPQYRFLDNQDSQDHMNLAFVAPAFTDPDYMAMLALQNILSEGMSSRLQWHICERLGMVYDLDAGLESFFDTGCFDVDCSAGRGKLVGVLREVLNIFRELRDIPVGEDELARARERYRMSLEFAHDSPGYLAAWLAGSELYLPAPDPEACLARMEAITPQDVQAMARRVFLPSKLAMAVAGRPSRSDRRQILKLLEEA